MKYILTTVVLALALATTACSPIEMKARDTAAALQGALTVAQAQYKSTCSINPNQQVCEVINNGVSAQNGLLTAGETYCGWSVIAPPPNPDTTPCVPNKNATALLTAAIANAANLTLEIKGAI
jgi:hypothetical protein